MGKEQLICYHCHQPIEGQPFMRNGNYYCDKCNLELSNGTIVDEITIQNKYAKILQSYAKRLCYGRDDKLGLFYKQLNKILDNPVISKQEETKNKDADIEENEEESLFEDDFKFTRKEACDILKYIFVNNLQYNKFNVESCNIKYVLQYYYCEAQQYWSDIEASNAMTEEHIIDVLNSTKETVVVNLTYKENLERISAAREIYKNKIYGRDIDLRDIDLDDIEETAEDYSTDREEIKNTIAQTGECKTYEGIIEMLNEEIDEGDWNV